jgi:hypothetical protein
MGRRVLQEIGASMAAEYGGLALFATLVILIGWWNGRRRSANPNGLRCGN